MGGILLLGISYETWVDICKMYFSLNTLSTKAYLQWFPFTKVSDEDKKYIMSQDFYKRYIETSSFVFFPEAMQQSENYLQKSDGSFRNSSLIAPLLYLVLQAVGKEIFNEYLSIRPCEISVYYAGSYEFMHPKYKQDYDNFFKELNSYIDEYPYFIKTDITNFFSNINIDKLVAQIDNICNTDEVKFSQTQLQIYKELLLYCGDGAFPLIENSVASSYLSTIVYLDNVDLKLYEFLNTKVPDILSFRMVRYVDDLYILIASDKLLAHLVDSYNEIRNEYSSILKEYGLSLNTKKCCIRKSTEINEELKKSLYDEYYNGQKHNIEDLFKDALLGFLQDLSDRLIYDSVDIEKYNGLIDKHFSSENIEFTPNEVFNYFVYENEKELYTEKVTDRILELIRQSIAFINLDPKRLTVMIMKTHSDKAIRAFLNQLFTRYRSGKWNSYDTTIAISYLIQSKFQHRDLLNIIEQYHPDLHRYYLEGCKESFVTSLSAYHINNLCDIVASDRKAPYLYFMYLCETKKKNNMAAYAYYKNFFDRVTADMDFEFNENYDGKRPNYKGFYKENKFTKFYAGIENSESIISNAQDLRNANPISHSSSGLIDRKDTAKELGDSIKELSKLIFQYIQIHKGDKR